MLSRRWFARSLGSLAAMGVIGASAGCDGSPNERPRFSSSGASSAGEHAACRYLTSDIVANVEFNSAVNRIEDRADGGGVSLCSYGDEPDPKLLSVNSIFLIETQPAFLIAHHTTPFAEATAGLDSKGCVAGSIRRLGARSGVGSKAVLCVGKPGSVRGGWAQCGSGFYLSYYSPADAKRAVRARLDNFQKIAHAVAAEIGSCGAE